jgi:hypothetical protein
MSELYVRDLASLRSQLFSIVTPRAIHTIMVCTIFKSLQT